MWNMRALIIELFTGIMPWEEKKKKMRRRRRYWEEEDGVKNLMTTMK